MTTEARIVIRVAHGDDEATIRSPYTALADIRELPERSWDPDRKRWGIPVEDVAHAAAHLRARGWKVQVIETGSGRSRVAWIGECFDVVPPHYRSQVYRALAQALHPDHGGDGELMRTLTDVYRKVG